MPLLSVWSIGIKAIKPLPIEKPILTPIEETSVVLADVFTVEGQVSNASLKQFQQEYESLPAHLKTGIQNIIISDNVNAYCGVVSPYKVKGCAKNNAPIIYLDNTYRYGDLLHESIHLYSYAKDRVWQDAFTNAYQKEGYLIAVQAGNTHNVYEYFVSAYLMYMQNPQSLKTRCPLTYAYFVSLS